MISLKKLKGCIIHGTSLPYLHNAYEVQCHWCYRKYVYFWRIRGLIYSKFYLSIIYRIKYRGK